MIIDRLTAERTVSVDRLSVVAERRAAGGGRLETVLRPFVHLGHLAIHLPELLLVLRAFTLGLDDLASVVIVAERDGVTWIDDSKATNPHAAARALAAFPRVVWIAGGRNKGLDFDDLVAGAASRLVGVVLVGEAAEELMDALGDLQGENGYLFSALMVTDIIEGGTQLLCVGDCSYVHQAFDSQAQNGVIDLPGVMSRKKQVAPLLLSVL